RAGPHRSRRDPRGRAPAAAPPGRSARRRGGGDPGRSRQADRAAGSDGAGGVARVAAARGGGRAAHASRGRAARGGAGGAARGGAAVGLERRARAEAGDDAASLPALALARIVDGAGEGQRAAYAAARRRFGDPADAPALAMVEAAAARALATEDPVEADRLWKA